MQQRGEKCVDGERHRTSSQHTMYVYAKYSGWDTQEHSDRERERLFPLGFFVSCPWRTQTHKGGNSRTLLNKRSVVSHIHTQTHTTVHTLALASCPLFLSFFLVYLKTQHTPPPRCPSTSMRPSTPASASTTTRTRARAASVPRS